MTAIRGNYGKAIANLALACHDCGTLWDQWLCNPYVDATTAFLEKVKSTLLSAQIKLAAGSPDNSNHLRIVNSFMGCFDSSYCEDYSQNCKGNRCIYKSNLYKMIVKN